MSEWILVCTKCGPVAAWSGDPSILGGATCPKCSSTTTLIDLARRSGIEVGPAIEHDIAMPVNLTGAVDATVHAHATVHAQVAQAQGTALDATVEITPNDVLNITTATGLVATHRVEVFVAETEAKDGAVTHIEVRRNGEVIDLAVADDMVNALLEMLPRMLPPDHPEYPGPSDLPDDVI